MKKVLNYEEKCKKHEEIKYKWIMISKSNCSGLNSDELRTMMYTEMGKLWEIPECCIKQWCDEMELGISPAISREFYHKALIPENIVYVPCDGCMEKITKGRKMSNIKKILKKKYKHGN